jgi:hypothetical protein
MAASAFQSTTVELARITAASPTGIKAGTDGGLLCQRLARAQIGSKLSLNEHHPSRPRQPQVRTDA